MQILYYRDRSLVSNLEMIRIQSAYNPHTIRIRWTEDVQNIQLSDHNAQTWAFNEEGLTRVEIVSSCTDQINRILEMRGMVPRGGFLERGEAGCR